MDSPVGVGSGPSIIRRGRAWRAAVLSRRQLSGLEMAFVSGLWAIIATAVYGGHVAHSGFYADDWSNASIYHDANDPSYVHAVGAEARLLEGRPLLGHCLKNGFTAADFGEDRFG